MKQIIMLLIAVMTAISASAQQYDFSQQISSGQTLFFKIIDATNKHVEIVPEKNENSSYYTTKPTGDINLPGTIENNGTTYTVTSIGDNAFNDCGDLTGDLKIPNTVTTIGNRAFSSCCRFYDGLTLSNTVTSIGDNAFSDCNGFSGDLIIPNSVTYIGKNAFLGCLSFDGGLTISNKVTTIEEYAFASCIGLTGDLTIPESDTKIGERAFEGCSGLIIK